MKAVLSNRIFIEATPKLEKELREALTYKIPTYGDGPPLIIRNLSTTFRKDILSLPIGRTDLIPEDYEVVDKRCKPEETFPAFKFDLRESQQAIFDDIEDNALINAKPSWGKTFTGCAISGKFGLKTLVVVHTLPLMHQWVEEVEKSYDFTPGTIGGGKCDYSAPITIGNVASLYTRMDGLGKEFGTILVDECHHTPSNTFTKIVDRSFARYKIGLSGTLERRDGKHVVIPDYFGTKVYKPPKENSMRPIVHAVNTGITFPYSGGWANQVTQLCDSHLYKDLISNLISHYERKGHRVLLVCDRVEFLEELSKRNNTSLIVGATKDRKGEFAKMDRGETLSMSATTAIFKEGISYNPLSCLIMATPINNDPLLEQLIGRIERLHPDKPQPIVVDPILRGATTERQFNNRVGFYMKHGFEIEYI